MVTFEDVEQHVWAYMRKRSAPGEQVQGIAVAVVPVAGPLALRHVRRRFLILTDQRVILTGRSLWGHQPLDVAESLPRDHAVLQQDGSHHVMLGDARQPEARPVRLRLHRRLTSPGLLSALVAPPADVAHPVE